MSNPMKPAVGKIAPLLSAAHVNLELRSTNKSGALREVASLLSAEIGRAHV